MGELVTYLLLLYRGAGDLGEGLELLQPWDWDPHLGTPPALSVCSELGEQLMCYMNRSAGALGGNEV